MKNKNAYIIIGVIVVILIVFFALKSNVSAPSPEEKQEKANATSSAVSSTGSKQTGNTGTAAKQTAAKISATKSAAVPNFPEIDFIDKRITFPLKDFPGVIIIIEKVAFGRGDAAISTGCGGIPNTNFSTYLYPGSSICLGNADVDGSPRGIVAFHILVENKSNIAFGGNSDTLKLHYLRSDSAGKPVYRFAYPIKGLGDYYINGYSSKEIIISFLVPEDQLLFNLVAGYKEPFVENKTLNVYDFSTNGLLVDFGSKILKIMK